jgi:protein TonB
MLGGIRISREQWREAGQWLRPQTLQGKAGISIIIHLVILFFLFNSWWFGSRRLKPSGTKNGVQTMVAYVPGKAPPAPQPKKAPPPPKKRPAKALSLKTVPPPEEKPVPTTEANNALGNDEVSIARVEGFPHVRPDLGGVGQQGDVILDVDIDDTGHVTQVHERTGINSSIDGVMVATVEQWIFHPALRGGKPIASKRELHFHFDRRRNPVDCGWDCFALSAD